MGLTSNLLHYKSLFLLISQVRQDYLNGKPRRRCMHLPLRVAAIGGPRWDRLSVVDDRRAGATRLPVVARNALSCTREDGAGPLPDPARPSASDGRRASDGVPPRGVAGGDGRRSVRRCRADQRATAGRLIRGINAQLSDAFQRHVAVRWTAHSRSVRAAARRRGGGWRRGSGRCRRRRFAA